MHVARDVGAAEDALDLARARRRRAAAAQRARGGRARASRARSTVTRRPRLEERLADEEAPALLEQHDARTSSAPSGGRAARRARA